MSAILFPSFTVVLFEQVAQVTENEVGISARLRHEIDTTKDPVLGYVSKPGIVEAYKVKKPGWISIILGT